MIYVNRMHYFYLMGRYEEALQSGRHASEHLSYFRGFKEEPEFYYIYSLTLLAVCKTTRPLFSSSSSADHKTEETTGEVEEEQQQGNRKDTKNFNGVQVPEEHLQLINSVIENQKHLKRMSDEVPINYRHQYMLVEAELARVR